MFPKETTKPTLKIYSKSPIQELQENRKNQVSSFKAQNSTKKVSLFSTIMALPKAKIFKFQILTYPKTEKNQKIVQTLG
jgi:hypothetical protein